MTGFIERDEWKNFLDDYSKRNQLRPTRLEVIGPLGVQQEEHFLPLLGVSLETKGNAAGSVEVMLGGESAEEPRHLTHTITNVERIAPLIGSNAVEEGLGFEDTEGGKTLLRFAILPELPKTTA
jgi:hypothetical protein